MIKLLKNALVLASLCTLFGLSILVNSVHAEEYGGDYAFFVYDPCPIGPNNITICFIHDSHCTMYIYLYRFDSVVAQWCINAHTSSGFLTYNANDDGVWRLYCCTPFSDGFTDETRDTFGISDPVSNQSNLGSDLDRHPSNWDVYKKALEIINQTTSSYEAAHEIYLHVFNHFPHYNGSEDEYYNFRSDLDLLNDLNTYGHYKGVCRSDAVILTSYARALGIPARIICLYGCYIEGDPQYYDTLMDQPHYFAEFYVLNCSQYQWVPVDGYHALGRACDGWFGQPEANQHISQYFPRDEYNINRRKKCDDLRPRIVTEIIPGYRSEPWYEACYHSELYLPHPYRNDL